MTADLMVLAWALLWFVLLRTSRAKIDRWDFAALLCMTAFPAFCVFAARHLP